MPGVNQIFVTPLSEVSSKAKEQLGALRWEGNKCYKYVKILNTTATVAGVAGDIACYNAEDGAETHTVVLDKSDADANPIAAGALQGSVNGVAGTAEYGWIQVKGPATLNTALGGSAADGDMLMAGTTDKALEKLTFTEGTPNVIKGAYCGVANDASAKKVILDCVF